MDKPGAPGYFVVIDRESSGGRLGCDGCPGLDTPLCVEYCKEKEDLLKMIRELELAKS